MIDLVTEVGFMALISCSECSKEISDKANSCVGCGAPVERIYDIQDAVKEARVKVQKKLKNGDYTNEYGHTSYNEDWSASVEVLLILREGYGYPHKEADELAEKATKNPNFHHSIVKREQQQSNTPKCPTCSSTSIQKIALMDKAVLAALIGVFAVGHASKTFYCNSCQYKW
jgi:hypothetical protein